MSRTILIVAAHSDDEAIGCAGTIAMHVAEGDIVHLLFMADGVGSRDGLSEAIALRSASAQAAAECLGVTSVRNFDFPDNKMDSVPLIEVVKKIERVVSELEPEVIYTHHIGDLNIDHQITHKAVMTACRPQPGFSVREVYAFEVLSSSEWQVPGYFPFCPNVFVDITDHIEKKRLALIAYKMEMREEPHSRSIQNVLRLAQIRGNAVGIAYAEAFQLVRQIRKAKY